MWDDMRKDLGMFTAAQAAQKIWQTLDLAAGPFTAAQAAQKMADKGGAQS